jgi:hypothetical protein
MPCEAQVFVPHWDYLPAVGDPLGRLIHNAKALRCFAAAPFIYQEAQASLASWYIKSPCFRKGFWVAEREGFEPPVSSQVNGFQDHRIRPLCHLSLGTYFLPEDFSSLPFYCEVINTDQHLGENEPFLIKYYLVDNLRNKVMNRYAGFQRASGAVVNPVLSTFNIANLPSGYYDLKVDVISKDNELIQKQKVSFYRSNPEADQKEYNLADVQLDNSFVTALNDVDTMTYYLDCLFPISTEAERRIAKNTMDTRDTERMQRFFPGVLEQAQSSQSGRRMEIVFLPRENRQQTIREYFLSGI